MHRALGSLVALNENTLVLDFSNSHFTCKQNLRGCTQGAKNGLLSPAPLVLQRQQDVESLL